MLSFNEAYPAKREPDPQEIKKPQEMKKTRPPRHWKWRGWVKTEIIKRKRTEIMNKLKYFALFPNAYDNG